MRELNSGKFLFHCIVFIISIGLKTTNLSGVLYLSVLNAYVCQFLPARIH